ncbi:splicing factor 3a [Thamnocephalis sphaerospora]|uniref:Splicing factor 3a n=1 Tax=Thamnocephalis sphaerospora TaxID=78915 RepID=A0A4V1IXE9_9FUNG|nr:splicing factor 3a [Thamnocephalis sphaerospora]|eukprot:RKP10819.1 splicing factor 3a [Thamnocephalis sphaerospora]
MESVLEQQRSMHEEIERLEQAIVEEYLSEPKTHKDRLLLDHRVNEYLERMQQRAGALQGLYADSDGTRAAEIAAVSGPDEFAEFYQRLRGVKDYHRRNPNMEVEVMEMEFRNRDRDADLQALDRKFSGEESSGRFLDLHALHDQFLNLKDVKRVNYLTYLEQVERLELVPRTSKGAAYRSYLESLRKYFEDFFQRTQPLLDLEELRQSALAEFEKHWAEGTFPGWDAQPEADNDEQNSLFCLACKRQYSKQTVFDGHLTSRKHIKASEALMKQETAITVNQTAEMRQRVRDQTEQKRREIAVEEAVVRKYAEVLAEQREATRANVERKQALTEHERQQEEAEAAAEGDNDEEDEEDEERIYNPLNLPLGWDGKPIPYWLYKLHGLGVEYSCEICGNFVYMGRKAFERHFQEWRHAHGMRCLGIPNTKHFQEITSIEDAYALWDRLKKEKKSEKQRSDAVEEYEDQQGNVFNKKTYDDLRRQGLL